MEAIQKIDNPNNNKIRILIIGVFIVFVFGIGGILVFINNNSNSKSTVEQNMTKKNTGASADQGKSQEELSMENSNVNNNQQPQDTVANSKPTKVPPFDPTKPWLKVQTKNGTGNLSVGKEEIIVVTGFSNKTDIDGYDILLSYDSEMLEIIDVESLIPAFSIQKFVREKFISVTGYKRLDVEQVTAFEETPVLQLKVKAKKSGTTDIAVLPSKGPETTKFTDPDVDQIIPQTEKVTIQVE